MATDWLVDLFAKASGKLVSFLKDGTANDPDRGVINFTGAGVTVTDNPGAARKDVAIPGYVVGLTSTAPADVGTAAAVGDSSETARANHVHAHGSGHAGGLHALATTGVAGEMSAADKSKLDGIGAGATVTGVTGTAPIASSGGAAPAISVLLHPEGSIVAKDDSGTSKLAVGALANDDEHGALGYKTTGESAPHHSNADASNSGFESPTHWSKTEGLPTTITPTVLEFDPAGAVVRVGDATIGAGQQLVLGSDNSFSPGTYLAGGVGLEVGTPNSGSLKTANASILSAGAEKGSLSVYNGSFAIRSGSGAYGSGSTGAHTLLAEGSSISCTAISGSCTITASSGAIQLNSSTLGFHGATPVAQATRAGQLTDSTGGSTASNSGALVDVGAAPDQTKINDNLAKLAAKVNALETIIHNLGLST